MTMSSKNVMQKKIMGKNWILKTVKTSKSGNLLLVSEEYDTYNYWYRYLPTIPRSVVKLLSIAVLENQGTWLDDWFEGLKDEDAICYGSNTYPWAEIKNKVIEQIESAEE